MEKFRRSAGCGEVCIDHLNKPVTLCGWVDTRRDHGGLIFIDLRDRSGIVQIIFNPEFSKDAHEKARHLKSEYVIQITGIVVRRSSETINEELSTGAYEVQVQELCVLNKSITLPFSIDDADSVDEELRLKYRYLDLRRKAMQNNMKLRNDLVFAIREFFNAEKFYEIETPFLSKNTAEGAREFLVPSRQQKGLFYALPQSPQLYKEILMAGGLERYFQMARCFRDEDVRADRQPEFTQLDLEMSFVNEIDVQDIIERMIKHIFKKVKGIDVSIPLARMSYDDAFENYGSDKPDLRFDLKINDFSSFFSDTKLTFLQDVLEKGGKIGGIIVNDHIFSRSEIENFTKRIMDEGAKGLLWIKITDTGIESPVAKFLRPDFISQLKKLYPQLSAHSTIFIIAGHYKKAWVFLGRLRLMLATKLNIISNEEIQLCWITDFPLFEYDEKEDRWSSVNHPFTSPQDSWEGKQPDQMKGRAYDLVMNGMELGGGSIRVHDSKIQRKMFEILGFDKNRMDKEFGFLLKAQDLGFPPLGGIALGIDRLAMLLAKANSIRDLIAFPKTQSGFDPLMESPTEVKEDKLLDYCLKIIKECDES